MLPLFIEAAVVALGLNVIVNLLRKTVAPIYLVPVAGAVFHLVCEILGINKWYCQNSYACSKNK